MGHIKNTHFTSNGLHLTSNEPRRIVVVGVEIFTPDVPHW